MKLHYILACFTAGKMATAESAQDLINSVLNPDTSSETFASYSSQIYYNATVDNATIQIPASYDKLEAAAKLRLDPAMYDYAAGSAGLEATAAANRAAFDRV